MRSQTDKPEGKDGFPDSPIPASPLLIPITSWASMVCESRITGVEFDSFWYESVLDGVCYFFRWLGKRRATVLVIFDEIAPLFMECRTLGDMLIPRAEAEPILVEVMRQFQINGFWPDYPALDETRYPVGEDLPASLGQSSGYFGGHDAFDTVLFDIFEAGRIEFDDELLLAPTNGSSIHSGKIASRASTGRIRK